MLIDKVPNKIIFWPSKISKYILYYYEFPTNYKDNSWNSKSCM